MIELYRFILLKNIGYLHILEMYSRYFEFEMTEPESKGNYDGTSSV